MRTGGRRPDSRAGPVDCVTLGASQTTRPLHCDPLLRGPTEAGAQQGADLLGAGSSPGRQPGWEPRPRRQALPATRFCFLTSPGAATPQNKEKTVKSQTNFNVIGEGTLKPERVSPQKSGESATDLQLHPHPNPTPRPEPDLFPEGPARQSDMEPPNRGPTCRLVSRLSCLPTVGLSTHFRQRVGGLFG